MTTRRISTIGVLAASLGALLAFAPIKQATPPAGAPAGTKFGAGQEKDATGHGGHMQGMSPLAKAAGETAMSCDACASHCTDLLAEGKREHLDSQRALLDCASMCATMACVASRNGPCCTIMAEACADACAACATQCEKATGDAQMKECADHCRAMEKLCRDCCKAAPTKVKASGS